MLSLNIPLQKLFGWFRRSQLWATGDWQLHHNVPTRASHVVFFGETSYHPGDLAPLQPRLGALWLLAFPETKITFEREKISDYWWDSGKYNGAANGNWENYVRSLGAYSEGDWGITALCTMFLASFLKIVLFIYFLDFVYLFLERGEGKEKEGERNINVWLPLPRPSLGTWPAPKARALTGNRTSNALVGRPMLNPLSHTS